MKMTKNSTKFKNNEFDQVKKFVTAFENNFHEIIINRYQHGAIEVYLKDEDIETNSYVQYCDSTDYFLGWLNGAVQCNNGRFKQ